jgi:hypothetical protein
MGKFMMGLAIIVLLATNAMTGFLLYQEVSKNNKSALALANTAQTSQKTTASVTQNNNQSSSSVNNKSAVESPKADSNSKNPYIYFIDDNKIKETIPKGKQCVLKCDDEFKLPEISSSKDSMTVFYPTEAVINTPYEQVLSYSGYEFYKNDASITFEVAKDITDFNELEFSIQFKGKLSANNFVVYLEQGKRIDGVLSKNEPINSDYSLKSTKFAVSSIDFTKKAVLVVQHKEDKTIFKYDIDFKNHVR